MGDARKVEDVLDALDRFATAEDVEDNVCFVCGSDYDLRDDEAPTALCDGCAHDAVDALAKALKAQRDTFDQTLVRELLHAIRHQVFYTGAADLWAAARRVRDSERNSEPSLGLGPIRTGRPEHLTLDAAERHTARLRELESDQVALVGRLLVVMHDEVLRQRALLARIAALPAQWRTAAASDPNEASLWGLKDAAGELDDALVDDVPMKEPAR